MIVYEITMAIVAKYARHGIVSGFEKVRNRELRELPCSTGDQANNQQPSPSPERLPQSNEPVTVCVLGTGQQTSCTNP